MTQNDEIKAVIQHAARDKDTQKTLGLHRILALGHREVEESRVKHLAKAANPLRAKETAQRH
jgi:hypothetical protein